MLCESYDLQICTDVQVCRVTHRPRRSLIASEWFGSGTHGHHHHSAQPSPLDRSTSVKATACRESKACGLETCVGLE